MAQGVKIPISVTGDEQAKADLKAVGQAVQGVGDAGAKSAGGLGQVGGAAGKGGQKLNDAAKSAKKLSESTVEVNSSAKAFASGIASQVNPQLGAMLNLVADGVEGIGKMSPAMLAIGGGAAVLTAVVAVFQHIAEEARKAEERIRAVIDAQKALREEAAGLQKSVADALADAGVTGVADAATADITKMVNEQGIERDLAQFGAVARQAARGPGGQRPELTDEQVQAVIAGYLATGKKDTLTGTSAEIQKTIDRLIKAGQTPEAQAFLEGRKKDVANTVAGEVTPEAALDPTAQMFDREVKRLGREQALSEEDQKRIRRLLAGEHANKVFKDRINPFEQWRIDLEGRYGPSDEGPYSEQRVLGQVGDEYAQGTTRTAGELYGFAEQLRAEALERRRRAYEQGGRQAPGTESAPEPVVININNDNSINATQWFSGTPDEQYKPTPDYVGAIPD